MPKARTNRRFMPFGPGVARVFASARLMSLRNHYLYQRNPKAFAKAEQDLLQEIKDYETHPDFREAES